MQFLGFGRQFGPAVAAVLAVNGSAKGRTATVVRVLSEDVDGAEDEDEVPTPRQPVQHSRLLVDA